MNDIIDKAALKLASDFHKKQDFLTEEQLRQCISEAILSGDFMRHCMPLSSVMHSDTYSVSKSGNYLYGVSSSQAMTYVPFRRADELQSQLHEANRHIKNLLEDINIAHRMNNKIVNPEWKSVNEAYEYLEKELI
jgi:hypothetical protein